MPYIPTPLLIAGVLVNPFKDILLLERKRKHSLGRYELPNKRVGDVGDAEDINAPQRIIPMIRDTTWLRISQLTTDVLRCKMQHEDGGLVKAALCAGVRFQTCVTAQVNYDEHNGYIWASCEDIIAGNINVTELTRTCVSRLDSEFALSSQLDRDDRTW